MRSRSLLALASVVSIMAACTGAASPTPSTAPASPSPAAGSPSPSGSPSPNPSPTPSLPTAIGAGEGELDIVIWPGYAEDGSNAKEYDWVHPFERETACKVKSKVADTSDDMFTLMTQNHGLYDGVSASGDATNRLIAAGDVAAIDVDKLFPDYADVMPSLQSPALAEYPAG